VFLVLWVTDVAGLSAARYGTLVAVQAATSMLAYIPAAALTRRVGEKPFVIATFVCFGLFPVAVACSTGYAALVAAFVIGGLREIGEPARKALIVDLAAPQLRARSVGLYYLVRGVAITPFAAAGGLLWSITPRAPLLLAGVVGVVGTLVVARVNPRSAWSTGPAR
jgi:MFS family permease